MEFRRTRVDLLDNVTLSGGTYGGGLYGSGSYGQPADSIPIPTQRLVVVVLDETSVLSTGSRLVAEQGDFVLLESGSKVLLEDG